MNLTSFGFVRVAAAAPDLRPGNPRFNAAATIGVMERAAAEQAQLLVCPELGLTGYTCGDFFLQDRLLSEARAGLDLVCQASRRLRGLLTLVGVPLVVFDRLFNCAALVQDGRVLGLVPKTYLPEYGEFMEAHWFCSSRDYSGPPAVRLAGVTDEPVPFGADLLFVVPNVAGFVVGVEICEDSWAPAPPCSFLAIAGATLIANLSASNELVGKSEYRSGTIVGGHSQQCLAGYIYAGAGPGESSTSLVFGGHCLIAENGLLLGETERFQLGRSTLVVRDVDVERLSLERRRQSSFRTATAELHGRVFRRVPAGPVPAVEAPLLRVVPPTPFVPTDPDSRKRRCEEIFAIQTTALCRRLEHLGSYRMVLGLSGGLDSTQAALVAARALERAGRPADELHPITMPGFGTSTRTLANARRLGHALTGRDIEVIDIRPACLQHFRDIGHPAAVLASRSLDDLDDAHRAALTDVVFENVQARERKQVLFDRAGVLGAIDIGTGDLTELALGWATFNGDHISNYGINCGLPKTLVQYLVAYETETQFSGAVQAVLRDILATPISPELLPLAAGEIAQKTEEQIGPFVLHDFFLYHFMRAAAPPRKIWFLACQAFARVFEPDEIKRWLIVFIRRFFANRFKSNCLPDGPKVGTISFDPRSDWRVPSDADRAAWLADLEDEAEGGCTARE